jgi:hypothetical protein
MYKDENIVELKAGMDVLVKHDQGIEIGSVETVNYLSGKVLVFFDYEACPHFAIFNFNQVSYIPIRTS